MAYLLRRLPCRLLITKGSGYSVMNSCAKEGVLMLKKPFRSFVIEIEDWQQEGHEPKVVKSQESVFLTR